MSKKEEKKGHIHSLLNRHDLLTIIIVVMCTIFIIITNYFFNQRVAIQVNTMLVEKEYEKIGGRENYLLMQELQKKQILDYIEELKQHEPELVKSIMSKYKEKDTNKKTKNILSEETYLDLFKDVSVKGATGALVSIIEFSDLECEYCIKFHNKGIIFAVLGDYDGKLNYVFKNFPLPNHANSMQEAISGKCVESLTASGEYFEFIDTVFKETKGGGDGYELSDLGLLSEKLGIDSRQYNTCIKSGEKGKLVKGEFEQGRSMGIDSTPSIVIINNESKEFTILKEASSKEEIEEIINGYLK